MNSRRVVLTLVFIVLTHSWVTAEDSTRSLWAWSSNGPGPFHDRLGKPIENMQSVDYRRSLVTGTIVPDRVYIDDVAVLGPGFVQGALVRRLGTPDSLTPAAFRNPAQSDTAYSNLMRRYPNTLHYYRLVNPPDSGWFKEVTWNSLDWGTVTAFLHADSLERSFRMFLAHVSLAACDTSSVELRPDPSNGLVATARCGDRIATWLTSENTLVVSHDTGKAEGK